MDDILRTSPKPCPAHTLPFYISTDLHYAVSCFTARDKTNLDIFWLKDDSLTDLDNLPDPDELVEEIIENLEAGLASFREILGVVGE